MTTSEDVTSNKEKSSGVNIDPETKDVIPSPTAAESSSGGSKVRRLWRRMPWNTPPREAPKAEDLPIAATDEQLEKQWEVSSIRKRARRTLYLLTALSLLIQAAFVWSLFYIKWQRDFSEWKPGEISKTDSDNQWLVLLALVAVLLTLINALLIRIAFKDMSARRLRFFNSLKVHRLSANSSPTDYSNLWKSNRSYIDIYHGLVHEHAKVSRRSTHISLWVGFLGVSVIAGIGLYFSYVNPYTGSVATAAGALLTGYVARAMLKNAEKSSKEVRDFFNHPLEVERALTAERLIESMPEDQRFEPTMVVVRSLVRDKTGPIEADA